MFTGKVVHVGAERESPLRLTMPTDGELQFTLPDLLKAPPISQHGNVAEVVGKFGGADLLCNAVNQLHSQPYAA